MWEIIELIVLCVYNSQNYIERQVEKYLQIIEYK